MNKQKKEDQTYKAIGGGATAGYLSGITKGIYDDFEKFKKLKKLPNFKRNKDVKYFKEFLKTLKPGDIILESSIGDFKDEKQAIRRLLGHKVPKVLTSLDKVKNEYIIPGATGGTKFTHAMVYLGNGQFAEADQGRTAVNRISSVNELNKVYFSKHNFLGIRFTNNRKIQNEIVKTAKKIVKTNYRANKDLLWGQIRRKLGLGFLESKGKGITCTEVASKALEKGGKIKVDKYISSYNIEPGDILHSKSGKAISTYGNAGQTGKQFALSAIGKILNPKLSFIVAGAGLGVGSALLWNKFIKNDSKNKALKFPAFSGKNGQWVTYKGRHIFIVKKSSKGVKK
jgi:hypothetical protein